jgi:peroxiredoxin
MEMAQPAGAPAAAFSLRDTRGSLHTLDRYAGSWLLLVFHRHLR